MRFWFDSIFLKVKKILVRIMVKGPRILTFYTEDNIVPIKKETINLILAIKILTLI